MNVKQLENFHSTRVGYLIFGVEELALSYLFGSLAVTSGSLWQWALTLILLIGVTQNFGKLLRSIVHDRR